MYRGLSRVSRNRVRSKTKKNCGARHIPERLGMASSAGRFSLVTLPYQYRHAVTAQASSRVCSSVSSSRYSTGRVKLLRPLVLSWTTLDCRYLYAAAELTPNGHLRRNPRNCRARHLVSSGNDAGGVAVFGGGGLLTCDKRMSWNTETGTLTVSRLQVSEVSTSQRRAGSACLCCQQRSATDLRALVFYEGVAPGTNCL